MYTVVEVKTMANNKNNTTHAKAMRTIKAVLAIDVQRIQDRISTGDLPEHATPSRWVNVNQLVRVHRIHHATIKSLIRRGQLDERPSDGFGNDVALKQLEI